MLAINRQRSTFGPWLQRAVVLALTTLLGACGTDSSPEDSAGGEPGFAPLEPGLSPQAPSSPVELDLLVGLQQAKLLADDGAASDQLGYAVALSGDTALVGAPVADVSGVDSGAAYVFVRSAGVWMQQAKLLPDDGATGDQFGIVTALEGDTAIVGAFLDDNASGTDAGAAYVFTRSGGLWTQQAKLVASEGSGGDRFGRAVALEGDTALVGAYWDDVGGSQSGSAYVFTRSGGVWTQEAKLAASDGASFDDFGLSLAVEGDTAIVGAHVDDDSGKDAGSAYIFTRSGGVWTQQIKIKPADGAAGDLFGYPVALSGNTVLMGAFGDDDSGTDAGSVYVYVGSGGTWTQEAKLKASDGAAQDYFGGALALAGDTALIGAYNDDSPAVNAGSAYLFTRSGGGWTEQSKIMPSDPLQSDVFGASLSLSGNFALVGAWGADEKAANGGAAYVFVIGASAGTACAASAECASGFCVDGVCCNSACGSGSTADCQACSKAAGAAVDGTCAPLAAATLCRAAAGACDVAESCDGMSNDCPQEKKVAAGTVCRMSAGACDVAESCDGMSDDCPQEKKVAAGTVCRMSAGPCDAAESCDGMSNDCPSDQKSKMGTVCRMAAGMCDAPETCDGMGNDCPSDKKLEAGTACRMDQGVCDLVESCDGMSNDCPQDRKAKPGTLCRAAAGVCDVADSCNGMSNDCPSDKKAMKGTVCRAKTSSCDVAESCDGMSNTCPTNELASDGAACDKGTCSAGACVTKPASAGCSCITTGDAPAGGLGRAAVVLLGLGALAARRRRAAARP